MNVNDIDFKFLVTQYDNGFFFKNERYLFEVLLASKNNIVSCEFTAYNGDETIDKLYNFDINVSNLREIIKVIPYMVKGKWMRNQKISKVIRERFRKQN